MPTPVLAPLSPQQAGRFTDRKTHGRGDQVLRLPAACLRTATGRPSRNG
jgi:hypothetical protein